MASIRPEEISAVIQKEIQAYQTDLKMESVGVVLQVGDGISRVYGLDKVMAGELVEFPGGIFGMALNLEEDSVGCVILGSDRGKPPLVVGGAPGAALLPGAGTG